MLDIKPDKSIEMTSGDAAYLHLIPRRKSDKTEYILQEGDTVKFTIFDDKDDVVMWQGTVDSSDYNEQNELVLRIPPEATKGHSCVTYSYDATLYYANGDPDTFLPRRPFKLYTGYSNRGGEASDG